MKYNALYVVTIMKLKDTSLYKLYNTNLHEIIENSRLSHLSKPK